MVRLDMTNGAEVPLAGKKMAGIVNTSPAPPAPEEQENSLTREILACVSANSYHISQGLMLSYSAILLPQLEDKDSSIKVDRITESPWIASAVTLAIVVGSLFSGSLMGALGRLVTVRVATIPQCIGWAVIATATNVPALIIGRFLTGFGTMGANATLVYSTEVARPAWRGALVSTAAFMAAVGTMLSYLLGALLPWRTVAWVCFSAPLLPLIGTAIWAPESPLWLAEKGKRKALEKALKLLARGDKRLNPTETADRLIKEAESKQAELQRRRLSADGLLTNFLQISRQPTVFRPMLLLAVIFLAQQFTGTYVVQFYAVIMFKQVGSAMDPSYASVIVGGLRVVFSVVTMVLLRWSNRRTVTVISASVMALSMAVAGYYANVSESGTIKLDTLNGYLATASILIYVTFSLIGMMTIPWIMAAELFPAEARSCAQGISFAIANVFMFASVQTYRLLEVQLGNVARVLWLYSGIAALSIIVVILFLPETHDRPLVAIETYFRTSWFYPGYERRLRRSANGDTLVPAKENVQHYIAVASSDKIGSLS